MDKQDTSASEANIFRVEKLEEFPLPQPWCDSCRHQGNSIWHFAWVRDSERRTAEAERDRLQKELAEARSTIKWIAQTVHQAHHDGAIENCRKNTCSASTREEK